MRELAGLDQESLDFILQTLKKFAERNITLNDKLAWDESEEFPLELIRELVGEEVGLHLVFLPEAYGGLGGGARDIAKVSEEMAKIDLGVATAFLAISLGTDPIIVGCTDEQKEKWLTRIAEGAIVSYAVTEAEAGSNLQSINTTADRILDDGGNITGYRINGSKQFITNGGYADIFTVLANTPDGPTFFVVEKGTKGLQPGKHEEKHGIRCSNTAPITLEDVEVPFENLVGLEEGQGLRQANKVFGYTRLMVAAFGLGAGRAAIERAMAYSLERVQFGRPLAQFQGYTHKLIVPHIVRLEAADAYVYATANRIDGGEQDLQVEGSIAKYFATEMGNAAAEAAIQALGGYGYIREYEVEKIKRDVKIVCIYEGTSEIQQNIIGLFRMKNNVRTKGRYYAEMAAALEGLADETGGPMLSAACKLAGDIARFVHDHKLIRQQHAHFTLADMLTWLEVADALCHRTAKEGGVYLEGCSRLFAREAIRKVLDGARTIAVGTGADTDGTMTERIRGIDLVAISRGEVADLDAVRDGVYASS